MDKAILLQTQEDDPEQHVLMEGKSSMTVEEFQALLACAPVVKLPEEFIAAPMLQSTPSKEFAGSQYSQENSQCLSCPDKLERHVNFVP
jgi:hypothetical protein